MNIGKSVVIKGELSGSEDLTIEGQVEGRIDLKDNVLTIGANGKIKAEVFAKAVVVLGEVTGNVTASEKVDIRDNGSVDGDISSPRVAIAEGAHFRGSVDMQRSGAAKAAQTTAATPKPATPPQQGGQPQQQGQRVGA
ncbi:MAG: polymer-forming cytoskeletal protein [Vicinamibacterales bacterium]